MTFLDIREEGLASWKRRYWTVFNKWQQHLQERSKLILNQKGFILDKIKSFGYILHNYIFILNILHKYIW